MDMESIIGRMVGRARGIAEEAHRLADAHGKVCEELKGKLDETRALFPKPSSRKESSDSLHSYGQYSSCSFSDPSPVTNTKIP